MARWTYRVVDTLTGRLIKEHVPFSGVRITDSLDNGGTFTGAYPVDHPGMPILPRDCIWQLMVWPCRDGVPQGAFIIKGVQQDDASSLVAQVEALRFDAILDRRELRHDLNFVSQDQLQIARDLCRYGAGINTVHTSPGIVADPMGPYKSLPWFRIGGAVSTVLRTIQVSKDTAGDDGYSATSGKFIGQMLRDLADASPQPGEGALVGFEVRADYGWDAEDGGFWGRVTFGWPTIGRTATDPNLITLEYPSKAVPTCAYGADGDDFATRVRVIGRERDNRRPTGTATNQALLDLGFPLLDKNVTSGTITESGNLNDRAAAVLYRQSKISSGWRITLNASDDIEPGWGTYRIGDHVRLRVRRGDVQIPDQVLRITGWTIEVDDTGLSEKITPELLEP